MHGRIGNWKKIEIKPEAFTLADFIGWLETKDPQATYDFHNCHGECLMGQYMGSRGHDWSARRITYIDRCVEVFGHPWNVPVLSSSPYTFGAALERARKAAGFRQQPDLS